MKINQQQQLFTEITLVLETKDEATMIWRAINIYRVANSAEAALRRKLTDWFTCEAKL